jgi:hypothetical protein
MVQISSKATHNEQCAISPQVIGEDVQADPENNILQDQETTPAPQITKIVPLLLVRACLQIYNLAMEMMSSARGRT